MVNKHLLRDGHLNEKNYAQTDSEYNLPMKQSDLNSFQIAATTVNDEYCYSHLYVFMSDAWVDKMTKRLSGSVVAYLIPWRKVLSSAIHVTDGGG